MRLIKIALVLAVQLCCSPSFAERGLWTFDSDPGLSENRGSDTNFQWSISNGQMNLAMTREAYPQRVYMPLSTMYDNNSHMYRVRTRFMITTASSASVLIGFFNSSKWNLKNTDAHVCFDIYSNIYQPGGYFGSGYNHMFETVSLNTWYVLEMDYKATNPTMGFYLYEGDGVTLINGTRYSTNGMYDGVDVVGFGNEDRSASSAVEAVIVDWLSWAINESLLPDPVPSEPPDPFTPRYAPIPEPDTYTAGLWLLDESEGPVGEENWGIYDQSGNGNHGVREPIGSLSQRPQYTTDVPFAETWNYSLDFGSHTNARVEIPDSTSLDITGSLTLEAWVNMNSISGEQHLVSKRNSSGPDSGYWLKWSASSQAFLFYVGTTSGVQSVESQSFSPGTAAWYHIAGVHDAVAGENRLYINGQLNNSAASDPIIITNDEWLVFGNRPNLSAPANARLDEIRISRQVLQPWEFGYHGTFGPANIIFGDEFESYSSYSEMISRSGGDRNHWKVTSSGAGAANLVTSRSYTPTHSVFLQYLNAAPGVNHELTLYYNLPVAHTREEPLISQSGWVSFTGEENVRLIFECQMWPGYDETHYGLTNELCAGSIEYWGDTQTWRYEPLNGGTVTFTNPIDYTSSLDNWHYYKVILDFSQHEYVSFQFDNDIWDISGNAMRRTPYGWEGLLPTIDFECRLYELASEPTQTYTAQWCVDNAVLSIENCLEPGDFNHDCIFDLADFAYLSQYWLDEGASVFDLDGDNSINLEDLDDFLTRWLH